MILRRTPSLAVSTTSLAPVRRIAPLAAPILQHRDSGRAAKATTPLPRQAHVLSTPLVHQSAWISSTPRYTSQALAAAKERYEQKYADRLNAKVKEAGLEDLEQLRAKSRLEYRVRQRLGDRLPSEVREQDRQARLDSKRAASSGLPPQSTSEPASTAKADKSPIKPLGDIVDLDKLRQLPSSGISQVWNGYHQMSESSLSAVIPYDLYKTMEGVAKAYSQFVVPLPREVVGEGVEKGQGAELYYLQWSFLPSGATNTGRATANGAALQPSTVLYTPLAQYKAHQTFAQPHLILTHYMDLVDSHEVVLMRGDVTEGVSTKLGDAQLLVLRLQQFYQNKHDGRAQMLRDFHEQPEKFDVNKLVEIVGEV